MRWTSKAALVGVGRVTVFVAVLLAAPTALAFNGLPHRWAGQQAALSMGLQHRGQLAWPNKLSGPLIQRDSPAPFFPELEAMTTSWFEGEEPGTVPVDDMPAWQLFGWTSQSEDHYELLDWSVHGCPAATPATMTIRHFWDPDIGGALGQVAGPLRERNAPAVPPEPQLCPDPLIVLNADLYPNAWNKASQLWRMAVGAWLEPPAADEADRRIQRGVVYFLLGHVAHLLQDQGQPAHTHEDMHNDSDTIERSLECGDVFYSWFDPGTVLDLPGDDGCPAPIFHQRIGKSPRAPGLIGDPGGLFELPSEGDAFVRISTTFYEGSTGRYDDPILLGNDLGFVLDHALGAFNLSQLFYLFYAVNQVGSYYPSNGYDGNSFEPAGWLNGYAGFPLLTPEGAPIQSLANFDDNEDPLNDWDGDLTQILTGLTPDQFDAGAFGHYGGYQASFMATHTLLDLFRRTVDGVPPITEFSYARQDGQDYVTGWNTSPVFVTVEGATDAGRSGRRPSGVAAVLARCEGVDHQGGGTFTLGDGEHVIQGLSYDMTGAVDGTDVVVRVDGTPPVIDLVGLHTTYLTSQTFVPRWTTSDPLSGVDSSWAFLDGSPVVLDQEIDLALMAGFHTLTVHARDLAGNEGWLEHHFEVVIDAQAWSRPREVNAKNSGSLWCFVELPAPYDIELVDAATVRLTVAGLPLPALSLGPSMDADKDGLADRMARFDAAAFSAAAGGQAGVVGATLTGRLAAGELGPGFTSTCPVALFTPGG